MADDKLVFHVVAPKNRNVQFFPLGRNLRGDARASEVYSDKIPGEFNQIPGGVIFGVRLTVDTKQRTWKLEDRMTLPENKRVREAVENIMAKGTDHRVGIRVRWEESESGSIGDADSMATMLYWCRRHVDRKRMHLVSGNLPDYEAIRRTGEVRIGNTGITPRDGKHINTLPKLEPETVGAGSGKRGD